MKTIRNVSCKYCSSQNVQRRGVRNKCARFQCSSCYRWFSVDVVEEQPASPAILIFDIETLPLEVIAWGIYDQTIHHESVLRDGCMLSWAAKWLGSDNIVSDVLTPEEAKLRHDFRIVNSLWSLLNKADIVVSHNGDKFDIPFFRGRLLKYRIPNPRYFRSLDTYKIAKSQFRIISNKLDYLLMFLGYDGKIPVDISLWKRCLSGDSSALDEMDTYCRGDVWKLEEVYVEILPYIPNHPNVTLWSGGDGCPNCGSKNVRLDGLYPGTTYLYDAYRCNDCSTLYHSRKRKKSNE